MLADTNYDAPAPPANSAPADPRPVRASRQQPGAGPCPAASCPRAAAARSSIATNGRHSGTDEPTRPGISSSSCRWTPRDRSTDLHVEIAGQNGLEVDRGSAAAAGDGRQHLEVRRHDRTGVRPRPTATASRRAGWRASPSRWIPTHPWDIGGDRYPLERHGDVSRRRRRQQPRTFSARGAVDAQVASAIYEMGAAVVHAAAPLSRRGRSALEADAMSPAASTPIETDGLTRRFGDFVAVDRVTLRIPKGQPVRVPRPQRRGQDDDDPHADDAAAAERGHGPLWGHDVVREPLAVRRTGRPGERRDQREPVRHGRRASTSRTSPASAASPIAARRGRAQLLDDVGLDAAVPRQAHRHLQHRHEAARRDRARAHGAPEGAVPRRAHARPRPAGQTRHVEPAARPGGRKTGHDVPQQPRRAGDPQPLQRDQRDRQRPARLHRRDARARTRTSTRSRSG